MLQLDDATIQARNLIAKHLPATRSHATTLVGYLDRDQVETIRSATGDQEAAERVKVVLAEALEKRSEPPAKIAAAELTANADPQAVDTDPQAARPDPKDIPVDTDPGDTDPADTDPDDTDPND